MVLSPFLRDCRITGNTMPISLNPLENFVFSTKNSITKQIESGYADLRRSEKQAADYILEHLEQVADEPIDRLARAAGVCAVSEKTKEELIAELVKINNGAQAACTAAAASGKNKE